MTTMTKAATGQVSTKAAEIYDRHFVPALFGQFAPILAEAAKIEPGESVLDIGTGTGVAALVAAGRARPGQVTAIDINPGMLAVARQKSDAVTWTEAAAEDLPFADASFDAVLCQFVLMFLADRKQALREMARVTRPGGRIVLTTFAGVTDTPGYDRLVPLLGRIVGPEAEAALAAPFTLGTTTALDAELAAAGLTADEYRAITGTVRHASLDAWLDTEIGGWTLADMVSAKQLDRLKTEARRELAEHIGPDGSVRFAAPAHLVILRH